MSLLDSAITPEMTLRHAGPLWLESRRGFIAEQTMREYCIHLKSLCRVLGQKRLDQIKADDVRAYQQSRLARVGAPKINKETSILQQILKRVELWNCIVSEFQPLPRPLESRGRALSEEEEYRLFKVSSLNPNWEVCYNAALLSAHTAAGPGEIRRLQLRDLYLGNGDQNRAWIRIREGAKNRYRVRTIPLDREAFEAAQALLTIAGVRGAHLPEHYLVPFKVRGNGRTMKPIHYDPTRCQTTFKKAWNEMVAAADIVNFRMYDLRHHALTRLAERAPEQVVLKIAGHCSPQMLRKVYAHVRDNAVQDAIESLSRPDGWKPKERTLALVKPKQATVVELTKAARAAKKVAQSVAPEDTSWLDLASS